MVRPEQSRRRFFAGFALAILTAPVATALGADLVLFLTVPVSAQNISDAIGGGLTFLALALLFGWVFAILPVLIFGSLTVAIARLIGIRSPAFFAAAGLLAGLAMAWLDARRSHNVINLPEAIPFLVGGCLTALAYWRVAER